MLLERLAKVLPMLGLIVSVIASGFVIGALARWAVPGPDPMPFWLTVLFGLAGAVLGGGIAMAALHAETNPSNSDLFWMNLASVLAAILLVVAYRRFVQKRPITGPDAYKPPTRGWGLRGRARTPTMSKADALKRLDDLHEQGVLTEEEYVAKRREVLSWP
jgi:uncharacterized membrane protein YeaQ/YmgE (transglycosylase-associated protein family)